MGAGSQLSDLVHADITVNLIDDTVVDQCSDNKFINTHVTKDVNPQQREGHFTYDVLTTTAVADGADVEKKTIKALDIIQTATGCPKATVFEVYNPTRHVWDGQYQGDWEILRNNNYLEVVTDATSTTGAYIKLSVTSDQYVNDIAPRFDLNSAMTGETPKSVMIEARFRTFDETKPRWEQDGQMYDTFTVEIVGSGEDLTSFCDYSGLSIE
jgi:hypothetical protein